MMSMGFVAVCLADHVRPQFAHERNHVTCIFCHEAGMTKTTGTVPEKRLKRERQKTEPTKPYPYSTSAFCASRCILSKYCFRM